MSAKLLEGTPSVIVNAIRSPFLPLASSSAEASSNASAVGVQHVQHAGVLESFVALTAST